MSRENVEIVRRCYEALLQGDWDQAAKLHDPDVELHGTVGGLSEGKVWRGLPQIRRQFERGDAEPAGDETRMVMERFVDGGDRVVLLLREFRRETGGEAEADTALVFELRSGRVTRIQGYTERASAFQAAGLSGPGG
jgi:ketosteroid isomerase-like protein